MAEIEKARSPATSLLPKSTGLVLTPARKRRLRPSLSPVKTKAPRILSRSKSSVFDTKKSSKNYLPVPSTAAVEFEEFSFIGPDGDISSAHVQHEHMKAFYEYLHENYDAQTIDLLGLFIVLYCGDNMPSEGERPFSIAGRIAIWKTTADYDDGYDFDASFGCIGSAPAESPKHPGELLYLELDRSILSQVKGGRISNQLLLHLADKVFTDCEAISILGHKLVIELAEVNDEDFEKRLRTLPRAIAKLPYDLEFHNGPLANTSTRSRAIKPNPDKLNDLTFDTTDYVKTDGKFYPGSMLNSIDSRGEIHSSISAGILLQRGQQRRLTCSWHNWEDHIKKYGNKVGEVDPETQRLFQAAQGQVDDKPGTIVGFLRERVGETDFGLLQLNDGICFENRFMEFNTVAKTLLRSSQVEENQDYIMDSHMTGSQRVRCLGRRVAFARQPRLAANPDFHTVGQSPEKLPNPKVTYIKYVQGGFASNDPIISAEPKIRLRACGTVFVKCGEPRSGLSEQDILARGEIAGMMHFCDLQKKQKTGGPSLAKQLLIFADSFDAVIDEGWTIAQV